MSDVSFRDYFSTHSQGYADYRPSYPMDMVKALSRLCPSQELALDVGCGTGQLSALLANIFAQVSASDASAEQIAQALPQENIHYHCALAQNSGLPNTSVDLITVAQAAHWLDLPLFYEEVHRIAKDNAILALITYGVLHVDDDAIDAVIQDFYYETLRGFWPKGREHVENGYSQLLFPFDEIKIGHFEMRKQWNLAELMGYFNTWSAVNQANAKLNMDCVEQCRQALLPLWVNVNEKKTITWPLSCKVAKIAKTGLSRD